MRLKGKRSSGHKDRGTQSAPASIVKSSPCTRAQRHPGAHQQAHSGGTRLCTYVLRVPGLRPRRGVQADAKSNTRAAPPPPAWPLLLRCLPPAGAGKPTPSAATALLPVSECSAGAHVQQTQMRSARSVPAPQACVLRHLGPRCPRPEVSLAVMPFPRLGHHYNIRYVRTRIHANVGLPSCPLDRLIAALLHSSGWRHRTGLSSCTLRTSRHIHCVPRLASNDFPTEKLLIIGQPQRQKGTFCQFCTASRVVVVGDRQQPAMLLRRGPALPAAPAAGARISISPPACVAARAPRRSQLALKQQEPARRAHHCGALDAGRLEGDGKADPLFDPLAPTEDDQLVRECVMCSGRRGRGARVRPIGGLDQGAGRPTRAIGQRRALNQPSTLLGVLLSLALDTGPARALVGFPPCESACRSRRTSPRAPAVPVRMLACSIADVLRFKKQREPFDNEYIIGLIWQQRRHVWVAAATLCFCTASNLAAPVLSGMLLEALVQQKPVQEYAKVRHPRTCAPRQRGNHPAGTPRAPA